MKLIGIILALTLFMGTVGIVAADPGDPGYSVLSVEDGSGSGGGDYYPIVCSYCVDITPLGFYFIVLVGGILYYFLR